MLSLPVVETRILKSRCGQDHSPSEDSKKESYLASFLDSGGCWHSLSGGYIPPISRPSLSPGVCSNSCPLSRWCHPITSSPVVPFSSRPQSFPALGSFPMSWLFGSRGQSIGASALAFLPPTTLPWPLGPLPVSMAVRVLTWPSYKDSSHCVEGWP